MKNRIAAALISLAAAGGLAAVPAAMATAAPAAVVATASHVRPAYVYNG